MLVVGLQQLSIGRHICHPEAGNQQVNEGHRLTTWHTVFGLAYTVPLFRLRQQRKHCL